MDDKIYHTAINYVQQLLKRNGSTSDPEDYVNESWLLLTEEGSDITLDALYKKARKLVLGEKGNKTESLARITTRICSKCKTDFPVGFFRIVRKADKVHVTSWCRECERIKSLNYPKENKKANLKNRIDNLTDGYVKSVLRACGTPNRNITPKAIVEKRKQILKKREVRNKYPKNLRDVWIRKVLVSCGYKYSEITNEDIEKRRNQIIKKRDDRNRNNLESSSFEFPL